MDITTQRLLESIKAINKDNCDKYTVNHTFNIFEIERISHKEVYMCRFLGAVLDPNAVHGCGNECLLSFAEEVLGIKLEDNSQYQVICEYVIDENRRIDLVIKGNGYWIPIEAKIGADDQYRQCVDYLNYARIRDKDAKLFYLTTDGRIPSKESTGELTKGQIEEYIKLISWEDIRNWVMEFCKTLSQLHNQLAICLNQYAEAIRNFVNNIEEEEKMNNELCKDADTLKAAATIYLNYNKAKVNVLNTFFNKLEGEIENKVKEIDTQELLESFKQYDDFNKKIPNFYRYQKSNYPAISYRIKKEKISGKLKDVLGEDFEFVLRIEVDNNLFIGLCFPKINIAKPECENKGMPNDWNTIYSLIENSNIDFKKDGVDPKNWWLAWKYIELDKAKVDFKSDDINSNQNYFKLCNPDKMQELVEKCCEEFDQLFNYCKDNLLNV